MALTHAHLFADRTRRPRPRPRVTPGLDGPGHQAPTECRRPEVVTAVAESVEATLSGRFAVRLVATGAGLMWWADTAPGSALAVAAAVVPVCVLWRWCSPETFGRCCGLRVRAGILRIIHYGPRWPGWARAAGLFTQVPGTITSVVPRLRRVISTAEADNLCVEVLPGHTPRDYEALAVVLRATRSSREACVSALPGGQVALRIPRHQTSGRARDSTHSTRAGRRTVLWPHRRVPRSAARAPRRGPPAHETHQPDRRCEDELDAPTDHPRPSAAAATAAGAWDR